MKKISFRKEINPCSLTKENLLELAEIAYSLWKDELAEANKEWEKKKLPELIKQIEEHNEALKHKRISYFAQTALPIEDPTPIIEKEKKYFLHIHKKFYEWRSNFKLYFNDKTITATSPDILSEELDTGKLKYLEFEVISVDGENKVKILISQVNDNNYYEIEGQDEVWLRTVKDTLNDIFKDREVPNQWLHRGRFKIPATTILASLAVFTIFTLSKKVPIYANNLNTSWVLWTSIFVGIVLLIIFIRIFASTLGNSLPYLKIEKSENLTFKDRLVGLLGLGIITNALYELIIWTFRS